MTGPLGDLRVVDLSTVIAGPQCARYLADFGADVVKVERPGSGDPVRALGWVDDADGQSMWWKLVNRGKRTVVLDLKHGADVEVVLRLVADAHVLVENFRPGVLERLGLGPDVLLDRSAGLVITRLTGFGQDGPYADRPAFATLAEAMSGFAAINGEPDRKPLLPPIALTDEIAGLAAAFATMVAVHSGTGQVVDVTLLESLLSVMGPLLSAYRLQGYEQPRLGGGIPYSVPRNTFRTADHRWVAISTSTDSVARRVLDLLGVSDDPRFATLADRQDHRDDLDAVTAAWIGARPYAAVQAAFDGANAACGPVYGMAEIAEDPQFAHRDAIVEVDGFPMQGLIAKLSETPGAVGFPGRRPDADGDDVRAVGWRS